MSHRSLFRVMTVTVATLLAGACATTHDIDPSELPPEATVDDGIDYYSADLTGNDPGAEELLNYGNSQWTTDDDGNRVYLLNRVRRGQAASYYVGDIGYIYVNDNTEGLRGNGYGNAPVFVSRGGAPLQSQTFRGGRDNTYYQTRRGRIIYLPNATRRPTGSSAGEGQGANPVTTGNSSTQGSPAPRPSTIVAPAPRPVTAPRVTQPRSQPKPRKQTRDEVRRPDR